MKKTNSITRKLKLQKENIASLTRNEIALLMGGGPTDPSFKKPRPKPKCDGGGTIGSYGVGCCDK